MTNNHIFDKTFLVYIHKKKSNDEIFYVGMGTLRRANDKINRTLFWKKVFLKHGFYAEIVKDNLTKEEAIELEISLISKYGRKDLETGSLVNLTSGGDGIVGRKKGFKRPDMSAIITKLNKERVWTQEARENMRKSTSGERSANYNKLGKDNPLSKTIICTTTNTIYYGISEAARQLNINMGGIWSVLNGRIEYTASMKYPGGMRFKYVE